MPNVQRDPEQEHRQKRIPGSRFWAHDKIASTHPLKLSHMLPDAQTFAQACSSLGISRETHVIFSDVYGVFSSPRAAWTFKTYGHPNVSVLNG